MLPMELAWLRCTIWISRALNDFNADAPEAILSVIRAGIH
jgi:hypothetical protein